MTPVNNRINPDYWNCSICLFPMDGTDENNGEACISKRCMHVFHRSCIQESINRKRECPISRKPMGISDLMDNPEYTQECRAWKQDPEGYTFENAFFKKYQCSAEEKGLEPKDILRPESLQGKTWNNPRQEKETTAFIDECFEKNYPQEEFFAATREAINHINATNADTHAGYAKIHADYAKIHAGYAKIHADYAKINEKWDRVDAINADTHAGYAKINEKLDRIEKEPLVVFFEDLVKSLNNLYSSFSNKIIDFKLYIVEKMNVHR